MIFSEAPLPGAMLIEIERRADSRGSFARVWCRREFADHGIDVDFVQASVSSNARSGTLRGLHFQPEPLAEAKLVRCSRGRIHDVVLDLRAGSDTFGQWFTVELDAAAGRMVYIPRGFAHGFQTLADDCEVSYMISEVHRPGVGRGVRYDDPQLAIPWPLPVSAISDQDRAWPSLREIARTLGPVPVAMP